MTRDEFKCLERGEIVEVAGNGLCVVESIYWQADGFKVDLRRRHFAERIEGIRELDHDIIRAVRVRKAVVVE